MKCVCGVRACVFVYVAYGFMLPPKNDRDFLSRLLYYKYKHYKLCWSSVVCWSASRSKLVPALDNRIKSVLTYSAIQVAIVSV